MPVYKLISGFILVFFLLFAVTLLALTFRGQKGNPLHFQKDKDTSVGSPFESSNSTSRYALVEAIAEHKTFWLNDVEARFASPDLVFFKGKYSTLFTPGVSFLGVPFYLLGKSFGLPQLFTYFLTCLLALVNMLLVVRGAQKFGATLGASLLAGFIFLVGSNALPYSHTFTQHHYSLVFILLAYLNAFSRRSILNNIFFGASVGLAALMDIPNIFMLFPVIIFVVLSHLEIKNEGIKLRFSIHLTIVLLVVGMLPFLLAFGVYNHLVTGSALKLGQTIGRTDYVEGKNTLESTTTVTNPTGLQFPFNPRRFTDGVTLLLVSDERGIFYYSPVFLLSVLGVVHLLRQKNQSSRLAALGIGVVLFNVATYSMFGDPWGGWSFGPRYLIPTAGILAIFLGVSLSRYRHNLIFALLFLVLAGYGITVNLLGALTTNAVPPRVEAVHFLKPIPSTYEYNAQLLDKGFTSSLVYSLYFQHHFRAKYYFLYISAIALSFLLFTYVCLFLGGRKKKL